MQGIFISGANHCFICLSYDNEDNNMNHISQYGNTDNTDDDNKRSFYLWAQPLFHISQASLFYLRQFPLFRFLSSPLNSSLPPI